MILQPIASLSNRDGSGVKNRYNRGDMYLTQKMVSVKTNKNNVGGYPTKKKWLYHLMLIKYRY